MNAQIIGTGYAVPENKLTNEQLEQMVDTNSQWIVERTGIKERRIGEKSLTTSDLCTRAAELALKQAGIKAEQLDLIIVATVSPDMVFPATACIVQEHLGAWNAAAFDLEAGCSGFIYDLAVAEKFLLAPDSRYNYVLVIGGDMLSRITDYEDRNTCILFGDAAGAAVLARGSEKAGILETCIGAEGRGAGFMCIPAGGARQPASIETVQQRLHYMKMEGREVFKFATKVIPEVGNELLSRAGLKYEDVDYFVPHQANIRIIKTAMKHMDLPEEKALIYIDRFGNTSAASIPVALAVAEEEGRLKSGDLILCIGFGAGLTYGGSLIRWGKD